MQIVDNHYLDVRNLYYLLPLTTD